MSARAVASDARDARSTLLQQWATIMLETLAVILLILWILGMVSSYTIGGFIHVLLVAAVIIFLVRIIRGRGPVV
jgi:hypothetical protein